MLKKISLKKIKKFLLSHKLITIIGFIGLIVLLLFFRRAKARQNPERKYKTAQVEQEEIIQTVSASGAIESAEEVTLHFQTSGLLTWVGVKEGDWVKKWQGLASLDRRELEKRLIKALRDYSKTRWDFEEDKEVVYKDKILTDTIKRILEKNQFDLDKAVADVEIVDIALQLASLASPIEGLVTEISTPIAGVNVTPSSASFTIVNSNSMKFKANIDELDIAKIHLGQTAEITLDAYPDQTFKAEVIKIAFASITTSGGGTAFEVEMSLPENLNQRFKKGMNGDVEIIINQKENVLTVPFEAIKEKDNQTFIQVLENNKIKEVPVKIGLESEIKTEILEGLQTDQIVIIGEKKKK